MRRTNKLLDRQFLPRCEGARSPDDSAPARATLESQRSVVEGLAAERKWVSKDAWYQLSTSLLKQRAPNLLASYGSPYKLLSVLYPEHTWLPFLFARSPKGYFHSQQHRRLLLEWESVRLQLNNLSGWYAVSWRKLSPRARTMIVMHFDWNLSKALEDAFPEHRWQWWNFKQVPKGVWANAENRKEFFSWLEEQLGITHPEQWYDIHMQQLYEIGFKKALFSAYEGSIHTALSEAHPSFRFRPWLFKHIYAPPKFWTDPSTHLEFFNWLAHKLGISEASKWYNVTAMDVAANGGSALIRAYYGGNLASALRAVYPTHDWADWKFKGATDSK